MNPQRYDAALAQFQTLHDGWKVRFEGTGAIHIVADCNLSPAEIGE